MDTRTLSTMAEKITKQKELINYSLFAGHNIFITDKKGNTVNLEPNSIQIKINNKIDELRKQGIPPRIVVLKARQTGLSTNQQGRIIWYTTKRENRSALIVAHNDKTTRSIFEKAKFMYDHLPNKPLQKASNATELVFDKPTNYNGKDIGLNSKVVIQVAGSNSIGRGDTFHIVHLSEYAFWEGKDDKSPSNQLTGILQAVPNELDTEVVVESTANGYNDFKTLWDEAVKGLNAFTPMFFAWFDHNEYTLDLNESEEDFKLQMSEYERYLYDELKLPLERINWWRWALKNLCNGNINMMKQENPSTPEEAFLMSGTPVFNNDIIMKRIEALRKQYEAKPFKQGYFEFEWNNAEYKDFIKKDTIKFIESDSKVYVRIYCDKKQFQPYAIAGDTKGEGKDFYTGQVMDNVTTERVATLYMQLNNSKPYTWQMYCLGIHYNEALIGVEMNFNTAPIEELERLNYPNQYVRQKQDDYTKGYLKKLGWKTDGITRPLIIDKHIYNIENHIELFNDIQTLQEAITFVYDKDGRPDAMTGKHDDLLMADMILSEIRGQQSMTTSPKEYDIDWSVIPEDLIEDYERANEKWKQIILDSWRKQGLFKSN